MVNFLVTVIVFLLIKEVQNQAIYYLDAYCNSERDICVTITCYEVKECSSIIVNINGMLDVSNRAAFENNVWEPKHHNKTLTTDVFKQMNVILRLLTPSNESFCDFVNVGSLQVRRKNSSSSEQFWKKNCQQNNRRDCQYKTKTLDLSKNSIPSLENASFCEFRDLETLNLEQCQILEIQPEAFSFLTNIKIIDLSRNNLTNLPANLFKNNKKLAQVNLKNNRLNHFIFHAFRSLTSLQKLDFTQNNIQSLENSKHVFDANLNLSSLIFENNEIKKIGLQFASLKQLKTLDLTSNEITEIHKRSFFGLISVEHLHLSRNRLKELHAEAFVNNSKLKVLNIDNNRLTIFPKIANLLKLEKLRLNFNRITSIKKLDLINNTALIELILDNNQIVNIDSGAFDHFNNALDNLDLSNNQLVKHGSIFKHAKIRNLNLDGNHLRSIFLNNFSSHLINIHAKNNQIQKLESNNSFSVKPTRPKLSLHLSNNSVARLNDVFLPEHVHFLNLENNIISALNLNSRLMKLNYLNVKNNRISTLCVSTTDLESSSSYSSFLHLADNPLECNCENLKLKINSAFQSLIKDWHQLECFQYVTPLNVLKKVKLESLENEQFLCQSDFNSSQRCVCHSSTYPCEFVTPQNCYVLADRNFLTVRYFCQRQNLSRMPSGFQKSVPQIINLQAGVIKAAHPRFEIYLNGNNFPRLKLIEFDEISHQCVALDLSNSNIQTIENDTFERLIGLKILNLHGNRLKSLPENLFQNLELLEELRLSDNKLMEISSATLSFLSNLKKLETHDNRLTYLPINETKQLSRLTNLTLHGNPWSCECEFVQVFHNYLGNRTSIIYQPEEIDCVDKFGSQYSVLQFDTSTCKAFLHLTAIITSTTFGIAIVIIAVLLFIYHREMQVIIYSRYGFRIFEKNSQNDDYASKQYDAFIAYSSKDDDFLLQHFMPGLEDIDNPYRLCIHDRDFPGGGYIQDSILEAVRMSSRTIILLSENFVQSGWCRYEFKIAHVQMLEDRCPRVLVIVVGDVPELLDPEMRLYLKTNTYLKWGEKLFWEKLYYAMPDKRVISPPTEILPMYKM